ncbi:zinc-ribbon domain-containing protein [Peribacillus sp. NPDC097284]|uniref:zinc-ribbon domain-containing protein n=1 Tax=Peribacillus sp. NPDC097284 TaxID=3364401 RepID=UPI00381D9BE1
MGGNKGYTIQSLIDFARSKEGYCLSDTYYNIHHKYLWKCKEGHKWEAPYSRIKSGGWCPVCNVKNRADKKRKYTIEDMRLLAKNLGGSCLSEEFVSVTKKLLWKCARGHEWDAIPSPMIHRGVWCPSCARERAANPELTVINDNKVVSANSRRLTIEHARKLAEEKKGRCLSDKYINARMKLTWKCEEGHTWEAPYDSIRSGRWCRVCARIEPNTIEKAQQLAAKKNGRCLSREYRNTSEKLTWMCAEGHKWEASYSNVYSGKWCKVCARNEPKTIKDAHQLAKSRLGKCLSSEYVNAHEKLTWECSGGHVFEMNYNNAQQGKWCGYCHRKLNEQKSRYILESFFDKKFPARRDVLGNGYELDGYNEDLKLAFEYQGIQHSKEHPFFHQKKGAFEEQLNRDLEKRRLSKEKGILLVEIPFNLINDEEKIEFLYKFIVENGYKVKQKQHVLEKMSQFYLINSFYEELRRIAKERNGELLSKYYNGATEKLNWLCENEHEFLSTPASVKSGKWCPECKKEKIGDAKRKYSIEDMRKIAEANGGKCLSSEFKSSLKHLTWQCAEGHVWNTTFSIIKGGGWCPDCSGNVLKTIEEAKQLAISKGGECLSLEYLGVFKKLTWKCGCGHIWDTSYHQVDRGSWCPECAKVSRANFFRKYSIEDMQLLAAEKNGECLSRVYESYNKKLLWKCENGHRFEKSLSNFKKGQWCPTCKKVK